MVRVCPPAANMVYGLWFTVHGWDVSCPWDGTPGGKRVSSDSRSFEVIGRSHGLPYRDSAAM